jgi:meiotically up-regulated gene 157 (Mug157) protein
MASKPGPLSTGKRQFPFLRPPPECRAFKSLALEDLIERMRGVVKDPDLFRLFENSYPITLDTMVKWRGYANKTDEETKETYQTDEELAYIITGDIDAMWLRDSASQIYSYLPLLEPSDAPDSLASLWRGLINSHARYIKISPYCHSFQPPPESGIPPTHNGAYSQNHPNPSYDRLKVFDCKWELDSLASFLQISSAYYKATGDIDFFGRYSWVSAVSAAVAAAGAMRLGTYDKDGRVLPSAWTFTGWTNRGSETLTNDGLGNPVRQNGMVRSAFRPSDDATIFQLLVPANMMWAKYLEEASLIMEQLDDKEAPALTAKMRGQAAGIRAGIERDAIVPHRDFGEIFAYEVDGFGGANLMDDANVPSLLAMPLWNYSVSAFRGIEYDSEEQDSGSNMAKRATSFDHDYGVVYRNTRAFILSDSNPYFAKGPVISAVGGPHLGPGKAWPMAAIVAGLTAFEPASGLEDPTAEVEKQLRMVLESTSGMGVVHETVSSWDDHVWTRPWFGWANGLFGELILRIDKHEKDRGISRDRSLLGRSWQ